ncbi:MAG TPA: hypothetical protein VK154_09130 [Chitinophagales bacterium]|nr:hypothetical protein [Chitinophagales bacterium]
MKKMMFYMLAFVTLTGAASCKCYTCKKDNAADFRLCKEDYANETDYKNAVNLLELGGYTCKKSN